MTRHTDLPKIWRKYGYDFFLLIINVLVILKIELLTDNQEGGG